MGGSHDVGRIVNAGTPAGQHLAVLAASSEGQMTEQAVTPQPAHRWYARPVFFVADVHRALAFYVDMLGFTKGWHTGDGTGGVCQVNHGECEIILCQDSVRIDKARLFIELTPAGLADLRRELDQRSVPVAETWWGYDSLQLFDPDGNELLFPISD